MSNTNATPQPFDLVTRAVKEQPDAPAIVSRDARISYRELFDSAKQIAGALRDAGVHPGDVVGISLPPQLEAVVIAACFHEAAISCHLSPAVTDTQALGIAWHITDRPRADFPEDRTIVVTPEWLAAVARRPVALDQRRYDSGTSICRLVFSSGTTGTPKAVPFSIDSIEFRTRTATDYWMSVTPFMSLLGIDTVSGFQTFYAQLANQQPYVVPADGEANRHLLASEGIRSIKASPAQLALLSDALTTTPTALSSLELIQTAGSSLPTVLAQKLQQQTSAHIVNLYGSTEGGTIAIRSGDNLDPSDVGTIVHDAEVEIVDDTHAPVAMGVEGQIRYRRPFQASEYFRNPDATAVSFRDGWFYPGDRGRVDDNGHLWLAGRTSEIINAAGTKVDPSRVDNLVMSLGVVTDAATFAATDANGLHRVGLAFVCEPGADIRGMGEHLRGILADSAPTVYWRIAQIPRNAMGKPLRRELTERYAARR